MFDFEYQLKMLPEKSGVYLMKNNLGAVIYVGKAKVLKNRVRQYFQKSKNHSEKVKAMVRNVAEFEYIITDTEMEALILECNLIKKYKPKYNILLKDDKSYPVIKITINEDFPRVFMTRTLAKDGAKYFGPYPLVSAVYETLELIKKIFPLRTCKMVIKENETKIRPCLNYHIGLCKAPCAGYISKEEYQGMVKRIIDILSGKDKSLVQELKDEMQKASENFEFEKAAVYRDKIYAIKRITEKQKIVSSNFEDEDYIAVYQDELDSCAQVFFVRDGKILGREHFILEGTSGEQKGELISDFLKEFYGGTAFIPKSIYVEDACDIELIEELLSMKSEHKVSIKIPQKGEKKNLVDLVKSNAQNILAQFKNKIKMDIEVQKNTLNELKEILNMDEVPERIEAYDISNIQGVDSVGSMIVFENGKAKHSDYRRFKINTVKGANDYDSMREILLRRFKRGLEEIKEIQEKSLNLSAGKFCVFPDLILMDGGKGQVNVALEVLKSFGIHIPVCGMVKDDKHNTRGLIYNNAELDIKKDSNLMNLITRIQDEVHRFAITYHRSLRNKRILHSVLEDIPGVGEKRRIELLKKFQNIENIKKAELKELEDTPSMDKKSAESIYTYFRKNK